MAINNYSPWADAGRYGQGLADTLGRILLTIPQIRQQNAQQQYQMQRQQRQDAQSARMEPLTEEYTRSQIQRNFSLAKEDEARAGYYNKAADNKNALNDVKTRSAVMMHEQAMKASQRLVEERQKRMGAQKPQFIHGSQYQEPGVFQNGQFTPQPQQPPMAPPQAQAPQQDPRTLGGFMNHPLDNTVTGLGDLLRMLGLGGGQQQPQQQGAPQGGQGGQLTPELAHQFLQQAGGDKEAARALARQAGYNF